MLNIFSEELKSKREQAGFTIQQIASKTRIDKKFLELIEQGNFSFLPELYVKSFIKEYAEVIGLNPEETIKRYQLAKEGKLYSYSESEDTIQEKSTKDTYQKPSEISFVDSDITQPIQTRSTKKNNIVVHIILAAAFVILILAGIISLSKRDEIIIEETPLEEIINQQSERFEEDRLESNNLIEQVDSIKLEIFTEDTTWVYLIIDGNYVSEFILYPKSKRTIKAKSKFEGTIGNSGSTILTLNDKPLEFSGRKNLPRHFSIDRNFGLEYLNSRPIISNYNVR
jgi:transcriptional regulator with XRE-family HTH domain